MGKRSQAMRPLRPRARLLHTLGTDLISSEVVAVLEMVKNAYDADASTVVIRFREPLSQGDGALEIWDDGHGMSPDTVEGAWLEIATPFRKRSPRSETKGRRVLGEKGIGRLAAARIARTLRLVTRRADGPEAELRIDWADFSDDDAYLDDIKVGLSAGPPKVFAPGGDADLVFTEAAEGGHEGGRGTVLDLAGLNKTWTEDDVKELRRALSRLIPPPPDRSVVPGAAPPDFRIVLDLPDALEGLSGEVASPPELEKPHYRLFGRVEGNGDARFRYVESGRGLDERIEVKFPLKEPARAPRCGPVGIDIRVWDRDVEAVEAVAGKRSVRDFRRLLDEASGVSVYRDAFRIMPYGERGNDWLALDHRRVQNPTLRISNNQVIGYVFIGGDENPDLRDQTNREGLIAGPALDDLVTVVRDAISLIERRRYEARRPSGRPRGQGGGRGGVFSRFSLSDVHSAVAARHPGDRELVALLAQKDRDIQDGVRHVQEVLARYSRLATLGSLVDRILHDGRTAVAHIKNLARFGLRDLDRSTTACEDRLTITGQHLRGVQKQADSLTTLFRRIEPFGGRQRGRPRMVKLEDIVRDGVAVLQADAREVGAVVEVNGAGTDVRADPSEIEEVVVNLLSNALYWVSTLPDDADRRVRIDVARLDDSTVTITVSDSGPGVPEELRDLVFDPYYSTKPDGVGLGLDIAGGIVADYYDGELELLETGALGGATFRATLRRRV